jgi:CO dehydrogenase maturation factor
MAKSGGAVLAVDADSNSCLGLTMGVEPENTVAEIREQSRSKQPTEGGMDKVRSLEYGLQQVITEATGFDLLTMGRPEGPDCYCAVNNLLRKFMDNLGSTYSFVVLDNEAGMEHLSRRTTNNVDVLCIVAEATPIGEITARRIHELAQKLPIKVNRIGVIWNRSKIGKEPDEIETFGAVPYDKAVLDASMQGKTIFDVEQDSPALVAVQKILEEKLKP